MMNLMMKEFALADLMEIYFVIFGVIGFSALIKRQLEKIKSKRGI